MHCRLLFPDGPAATHLCRCRCAECNHVYHSRLLIFCFSALNKSLTDLCLSAWSAVQCMAPLFQMIRIDRPHDNLSCYVCLTGPVTRICVKEWFDPLIDLSSIEWSIALLCNATATTPIDQKRSRPVIASGSIWTGSIDPTQKIPDNCPKNQRVYSFHHLYLGVFTCWLREQSHVASCLYVHTILCSNRYARSWFDPRSKYSLRSGINDARNKLINYKLVV